jgi:hypothetical protein
MAKILRYLALFSGWTVAIIAGGAMVGAVVFPLAGALIGADSGIAELAANGARKLGFLSFVWAPGIALVVCFHRAYLDRNRRSP